MPWKERLQVFAGVSFFIGLATWQVLGKTPQKPGHDTFSSEKPEALRKETKRDLDVERAKMLAAEEQRQRKAA